MISIHSPVQRELDPSEEDNSAPVLYAAGLLLTVSLMLFFGLMMLYSTSSTANTSSYFYVKKQLIWGAVGTFSAATVFVLGYRRLSSYKFALSLVGGVALLLIYAATFGPEINGAHRWIRIPGVGNLQPSEFAKLAIMLLLSRYCADKIRYLNEFHYVRGFLPMAAIAMGVVGLILIGGDLGTTSLVSVAVLIVFFTAGLRLRYFLPAVAAIPVGIYIIKRFDPERWARLTSFLNPELYKQDESMQLWNSLLAFGSGSWFGVGLFESRMKARYLPEAHTDFILSIVGEELGFVFICLVLLGYGFILFFGLKISTHSSTKQGMFLAVGITSLIVLQAVINVGVVSGAFPTKGMPAPFISYGGSNLVVCLTGIGLLVNIALESAIPDLNRRIWNRLGRIIPLGALLGEGKE